MWAEVLILTDRPNEVSEWRSDLQERGYAVALEPWQPDSWKDIVLRQRPSLVLIHTDSIDRVDLHAVQELREQPQSPCIILSGQGEVETRVRALDAGVDACLAARTGRAEAVARLSAVLRRAAIPASGLVFSEGDLSIDLANEVAFYQGNKLSTTDYEFRILRELALKVMEQRSHFQSSGVDDRLPNAIHDLTNYLSTLEERTRHRGRRYPREEGKSLDS